MVAVYSKVKKWIDEGKDPRSAHWQAGLDKVLDLFLPDLEKGKIIPVRGMEERDLSIARWTEVRKPPHIDTKNQLTQFG